MSIGVNVFDGATGAFTEGYDCSLLVSDANDVWANFNDLTIDDGFIGESPPKTLNSG